MKRPERRRVIRVTGRDKVEFAREQRQQPTRSEAALWQALRRRQLGVRFRRQHPIGDYVADFYCAEARIAIELDGPIHEQQRGYDRLRDAELSRRGIRVLRVPEDHVRSDLQGVLARIRAELGRGEAPRSD